MGSQLRGVGAVNSLQSPLSLPLPGDEILESSIYTQVRDVKDFYFEILQVVKQIF